MRTFASPDTKSTLFLFMIWVFTLTIPVDELIFVISPLTVTSSFMNAGDTKFSVCDR